MKASQQRLRDLKHDETKRPRGTSKDIRRDQNKIGILYNSFGMNKERGVIKSVGIKSKHY
ncbi:hypothetical protein WN55_01028 [Dufourea novaeangliae]|uniref:Uncharacterized protein n=1 Tax=Dufourea novaeangliae TaxID=178035 RepID=A0A154PDR4_DUFNO|nr:hypothetical protein WN55_01028 [Dufourea novaeangliae]